MLEITFNCRKLKVTYRLNALRTCSVYRTEQDPDILTKEDQHLREKNRLQSQMALATTLRLHSFRLLEV